MDHQCEKYRRHAFGFLTVSILLGIGSGFAPMDVRAGLEGYNWKSEYYIWQTLVAMSLGGGVGFVAGRILDAVITEEALRNRFIRELWKLYCCLG